MQDDIRLGHRKWWLTRLLPVPPVPRHQISMAISLAFQRAPAKLRIDLTTFSAATHCRPTLLKGGIAAIEQTTPRRSETAAEAIWTRFPCFGLLEAAGANNHQDPACDRQASPSNGGTHLNLLQESHLRRE